MAERAVLLAQRPRLYWTLVALGLTAAVLSILDVLPPWSAGLWPLPAIAYAFACNSTKEHHLMSDEKSEGLLPKYHVQRNNDPRGKHDDCRYFVLDPQHDPIARSALETYGELARREGYAALADDLREWLRSLPEPTTEQTCRVCGAVNPRTAYDHDGAAHDLAGVIAYDRDRAKREGPKHAAGVTPAPSAPRPPAPDRGDRE